MAVWPALADCTNDHLAGYAAIACLDDRVQPLPGATPVQRCDECLDAGADWSDEDAARAVASATGGRVVIDVGEEYWQPFVLPEVRAA